VRTGSAPRPGPLASRATLQRLPPAVDGGRIVDVDALTRPRNREVDVVCLRFPPDPARWLRPRVHRQVERTPVHRDQQATPHIDMGGDPRLQLMPRQFEQSLVALDIGLDHFEPSLVAQMSQVNLGGHVENLLHDPLMFVLAHLHSHPGRAIGGDEDRINQRDSPGHPGIETVARPGLNRDSRPLDPAAGGQSLDRARKRTMKSLTEQLEHLVNTLRDVLGPEIVGAYLYGSAVLGGLRPRSDLDVMVVMRRRMTDVEKQRLVQALLDLSGRPRPIEVTVVVQEDVRPWRYPPRREFQFGEWWRDEFENGNLAPWKSETDPDLASLIRMARMASKVLEGPTAIDVFDSVPRRDYVAAQLEAVADVLRDLEGDTRNVVLTLARVWTSLATDQIRSKDAAAEWALARLPHEHRPVLREARAVYLGELEIESHDFVERARAFAGYVTAQIDELIRREFAPKRSVSLRRTRD
jgi:predicted nucleotidyltransferase